MNHKDALATKWLPVGRVFKLWCRLGRTKPNPTGCTENVGLLFEKPLSRFRDTLRGKRSYAAGFTGLRSSNATSLNAGNPRTRVAPQPTIDANFGFENRP